MAKEKFLLLSLSESKTKELAQAVSNETCRKILDYLADKESTETELSENLGIPISTVHYNLQQLQKGNLVTVEEYHYSKKGKEINHYKLANKYIIIAPKSVYGIKEKLKTLLPVVIILGIGAASIQFFSGSRTFLDAPLVAEKAVLMRESIDSGAALQAAEPIINHINQPNIAVWFLGGALAALLLYILVEYFLKRKNR